MRFWFVHSGDVSLREQVVTQVTLGILTGELQPGERLPSIRELARRFDLHANTVSAGYRQLEAEGWVASRKGSGVYVRETRPQGAKPGGGLDRLIANLFDAARRLQIAPAEVAGRVQAWSEREPAGRILLVEPDPELRRIVLAEIAEGLRPGSECELVGCGFGECAERLSGSLVVVLPSKLERVKAEVAAANVAGTRVFALRVRSIPATLAEWLPARTDSMLIGLASRWPDFLRFARTMLIASGCEADSLVVRDATQRGWRAGLAETAAVVCDAVTAAEVGVARTIVFRLLGDGVAAEVGALVEPAPPGPA